MSALVQLDYVSKVMALLARRWWCAVAACWWCRELFVLFQAVSELVRAEGGVQVRSGAAQVAPTASGDQPT